MKDILANDNKAHLSISKIADSAKKDATIFESLAESLLDGEISISQQWTDINGILGLIAIGIAGVSLALFGWTILRLRKMAATTAILKQCKPTSAPSFIYKTEKPANPESTDVILDFDLTILSLEHAIFAFLVLICILVFCTE